MVSDGTASWIDGPDLYDAADLRRLDSVLLTPGGPTSQPFAVKEGHRVNGAGLQVSVGGSPESWTVTPGPCVVSDPAYAGQGGWRVEIPNAKSGTIGARPGAGTSRIDLIVVRVYDAAAIGSGPAEVKVERLAGTPGQTPSAPTPPAGSIVYEIGRLTVPASGAVTVTPSIERTVAAGGVLPVATTAAMEKLKADGIAYRGMVVDNAQTNALHRYDGTVFKPVRNEVYAPIAGPLVGGQSLPGVDPIIRKLGYATASVGAGGVLTLNFDSTFPGGVLHLTATTVVGAPVNPLVDSGQISKTSARLIFPGVAAGTAVAFTYEAIGW